MKAVIDSDVLIDYLQGIPQAKKELGRYSQPLYSVVSWMEVMCGADTDEEQRDAEVLFRSLSMVGLSSEIARQAVDEQRTPGLKLPDAVILATAECEGCIVVTRNSKDFDTDDPRVRIPYSI